MSALADASKYVAEFRSHRRAGSTHVTVIRDLELIRQACDEMERLTVQDMRRSDWTWTEIGEVYGISHQAARQRWKTRVE